MGHGWPDIPGVTELGGRPRLPRRPESIVALFRAACAPGQALTAPELVRRVARVTGDEPARLEGLAGWLPVSRVARWTPDGELRVHPDTHPRDLSLRFVAWLRAEAEREPDLPEATRDALDALAAALDEATAGLVSAAGGTSWAERGPSRAVAPAAADPLTERIGRMLAALDAAFLERHVQVRAVLLALLSGRHALLVGPPGTAKSMLARALRACFHDAVYFEYLLSRFTHPDELFGPVSIPGLKEEDYRRLTEGYLPRAHIAFLDEVFKANSAILNSLLTLVNERIFHHGRHRDDAPLIGLIGASNELPDPEGGLGALYDRFLVRLTVPPLGDPASFVAVATGEVGGSVIDPADALTLDDLAALRARAAAVEVPPAVRQALVDLWGVAADAGWAVSDRRWRQGVEMLRVAAATEGRAAVGLMDLLLLEPVLAPDPTRAADVRDVLLERVAPRAVPQHDLRAQWHLLGIDRVAPGPGEGLDLPGDGGWDARLATRRVHAERMVAHAEAAVARLGDDRDRVEQRGTQLWLPRVPARILSAHMESARELSRVLEAAERYRDGLSGPIAVARALAEGLPVPERRSFGAGVTVRLRVPDADLAFGLTLAAERVDAPPADGSVPERRRHVEAELFDRAPELVLSADDLFAFLRGEQAIEPLVERVPLHAARNVATVLARLRKRLGESGLPAPPPLGG